jgi:hypothetical protein
MQFSWKWPLIWKVVVNSAYYNRQNVYLIIYSVGNDPICLQNNMINSYIIL